MADPTRHRDIRHRVVHYSPRSSASWHRLSWWEESSSQRHRVRKVNREKCLMRFGLPNRSSFLGHAGAADPATTNHLSLAVLRGSPLIAIGGQQTVETSTGSRSDGANATPIPVTVG